MEPTEVVGDGTQIGIERGGALGVGSSGEILGEPFQLMGYAEGSSKSRVL